MALDSQPDAAPLFAAAVRYFGIPRERWALALARARQLGATTVATELPWGWHAPDPGVCDLDGATDARRDVAGFVRLANLPAED